MGVRYCVPVSGQVQKAYREGHFERNSRASSPLESVISVFALLFKAVIFDSPFVSPLYRGEIATVKGPFLQNHATVSDGSWKLSSRTALLRN